MTKGSSQALSRSASHLLVQRVDDTQYGVRPDQCAHFLLNQTADTVFNRLILSLPSTAKANDGESDVTRLDPLYIPFLFCDHRKLHGRLWQQSRVLDLSEVAALCSYKFGKLGKGST